jgi:hypothetical protein
LGLIAGGFWLQHAYNEPESLVDFADVLAGTPAGRSGIVFAPVNSGSTLASLYQKARAKGEAFLSPCGYFIDHKPKSEQRAKTYPWLDASYNRPTTSTEWAAWMRASLEHQQSTDLCGVAAPPPSIAVSPSPQLRASGPTNEFYDVVDAAADEYQRLGGSTECWTEIVVDRDFLREENHLTRLANALVSLPSDGIVFRCFQGELAPVSDRRLLEGLREVVQACSANDVPIFLPNSGWLGWLAMAWGAHGFSGGLSKSSWFDRMPAGMANVPRRPSIFEPQLLRHVRWPLHEDIAKESSFHACWCESCKTMGGVWDDAEAKRHQIRLASEEGATLRALPTTQRGILIRRRLDDAIAFRNALPPTIEQRADAGFLDAWRSFV